MAIRIKEAVFFACVFASKFFLLVSPVVQPGLIFMRMAGYNPEQAVPFCQRMEANNKGGKLPELNKNKKDHYIYP